MEKLPYRHLMVKNLFKTKTMETKKTNRADLENKKSIFLGIGFVIALAVVLLAFEWRTDDHSRSITMTREWNEFDELLPVNTKQPEPLPPPPPPQVIHRFHEVDNNTLDILDLPVIDAGIDPKWEVPVYIPLADEPEEKTDDTIFIVVQEMPEFPGGEAALYRFLAENIRYPRPMVEAGITGTVHLGFVVEKDGTLSSITVGRSPHTMLSDEAVRVLSKMPPWKPGKQRGKPVRVTYGLPVKFSLM